MNVPEALRAAEAAANVFRKTVLEAAESLDGEMSRIHSQLLEQQPKEMKAMEREDAPRRHYDL